MEIVILKNRSVNHSIDNAAAKESRPADCWAKQRNIPMGSESPTTTVTSILMVAAWLRAGSATASGAPTNVDAAGARRAEQTRGAARSVAPRGAAGAKDTNPNIFACDVGIENVSEKGAACTS